MRRSAIPSARSVVKTSVPLDPNTWARLCALAAVRQVGRGELAAGLLKHALRGVIVRDAGAEPAEPADPV